MESWWNRIKYELTLNRIERIAENIESYIVRIDTCPKKVQSHLELEVIRFRKLQKRVRVIKWMQAVLFFLLYISVIYAIFGDIFLLGEALQITALISGILGTTILFAAIAALNRLVNVYVSDAHTIASVIIANVVKYSK